ncbi:MAG TPA: response regulator [Acidobacteria bacterium]|nr:response regulator [Acidobacteriota bacterium]
MADETQLLQVLFNLADNARHAMSNGGTLTIVARAAEKAAESGESDHVVLEVSDTGTGIDPEHLPLIFEPFFTTRMGEGGNGLGLASVRGIVHQHGGSIEVDSELGRGTVFVIRLPAAPAGSHEPEHGEEIVAAFSHANGGHRVLLVEDHEEVRAALARSLRVGGYRVVEAADLSEARKLLESQPIDVLLSDLQLPDGIGYDLAAPAREKNPGVIVIFLSGFLGGLGSAADRSAPEGSICLEKPIRFARLDAAIREALANRRT